MAWAIRALVLAWVLAVFPQPAVAWKPYVHNFSANEALFDAMDDCMVTIAGHAYPIRAGLCDALRAAVLAKQHQAMQQFDTDGDGKLSDQERMAAVGGLKQKYLSDVLSALDQARGQGRIAPDVFAALRSDLESALDARRSGDAAAELAALHSLVADLQAHRGMGVAADIVDGLVPGVQALIARGG